MRAKATLLRQVRFTTAIACAAALLLTTGGVAAAQASTVHRTAPKVEALGPISSPSVQRQVRRIVNWIKAHPGQRPPASLAVHLPAGYSASATPRNNPQSKACLYYSHALCIGAEGATVILTSVGVAIQILAIIFQGTAGSGKDKGDQEEETPVVTSGGSFGKCLTQSSKTVEFGTCGTSGAAKTSCTWIQVPTGGSFALENEYWYDRNENANDEMLTASSVSSGSKLVLEGAVTSDHNRTWYYPSAPGA